MTSSEKFSLKWNDFQENVSSAFSTLREDTTFTDVTLVSEDGKHIQAHKVILSASSPFFKNILKMIKHPSPLVYLKGFQAKDLNSLIDFMYQGVADVYQDNLENFLAKAEELQLKGLGGPGGEEEPIKNSEDVINHHIYNSKPTYKTKTFTEKPKNEFEDEQYDLIPTNTVMTTTSPSTKVSFTGGRGEELKSTLWSMISQSGSFLTCTVCGKSKDKTVATNAKMQMENHVESFHVDGVTYDCSRCDQVLRSKNAFHKHTFRHHK